MKKRISILLCLLYTIGFCQLHAYDTERVSVVDFGAFGDGLTDDSGAFQSAINTGASTIHIPFKEEGYVIEKQINISKPIRIIGENNVKIISGKENLFYITSSHVTIEGLYIDMSKSLIGTSAITLDNGEENMKQTDIEKINIKNITVRGAHHFLYNEPRKKTCPTGEEPPADRREYYLVSHVNISNVECREPRSTQFKMDYLFNFIFIKNVHITNLQFEGYTTIIDFPLISLDHNKGAIFEDVDIAGHGSDELSAKGHAIEIKNSDDVWFKRVMADNVGGIGFSFNNCDYLYLNDVVASGCNSGGFSFNSCEQIQGNNIRSVQSGTTLNHTTPDGTPKIKRDGINGIMFINSPKVQFTLTNISNSSGHGLYLEKSRNGTFTNLISSHNKLFGIYELSTPKGDPNCNIYSTVITNRNGGNVFIEDSSSYIAPYIESSGTFHEVLKGDGKIH